MKWMKSGKSFKRTEVSMQLHYKATILHKTDFPGCVQSFLHKSMTPVMKPERFFRGTWSAVEADLPGSIPINKDNLPKYDQFTGWYTYSKIIGCNEDVLQFSFQKFYLTVLDKSHHIVKTSIGEVRHSIQVNYYLSTGTELFLRCL